MRRIRADSRGSFYSHWGKRSVDILVSFFCLPVLALLIIIVAPVILICDGMPVFYLSQRRGRSGRSFTMLKFRSMKVTAPDFRNPDGSTLTSSDDPRLTKCGKWLRKTSLDEFPQILNIILGDMSIVGPRPHVATRSYDQLTSDEQEVLFVRPGLTGYNQAYWRNAADTILKTQNDLYYVRHISFRLDMAIIWQTVWQVTGHVGINADDEMKAKK